MTDTTDEEFKQFGRLIYLECQAQLLNYLPGSSFGFLYESRMAFNDDFDKLHPKFSEKDAAYIVARDEWLKPFENRWGAVIKVKKTSARKSLRFEAEAERDRRFLAELEASQAEWQKNKKRVKQR